VKVVTVSSWLNFGRPAPPPRKGLWRGEIFWLRLGTASSQCLRFLRALFLELYTLLEMQIGTDSSYVVTLTMTLDLLNPKSVHDIEDYYCAKFQAIPIRGFRFIVLAYPRTYRARQKSSP